MYQLYGCRITRSLVYQLGSRFSLIDIILSFWAEYVNFYEALGPYPAIRRCRDLVMNRPLLRPFFDELTGCLGDYLQLQAQDSGEK